MVTVVFDERYRPLTKSFRCGNRYLDEFLRGGTAVDDSVGKTYLYLTTDKKAIVGYYNITTGSLQIEDDPCKIKIGGSVHINAFAVDCAFQGKVPFEGVVRYSDILLNDCIGRIGSLREYVGFAFITLASTDEGLHLYRRNGFEELEDDMRIAPEKAEFGCKLMYYVLDSDS